jgi:hypothetical protein
MRATWRPSRPRRSAWSGGSRGCYAHGQSYSSQEVLELGGNGACSVSVVFTCQCFCSTRTDGTWIEKPLGADITLGSSSFSVVWVGGPALGPGFQRQL